MSHMKRCAGDDIAEESSICAGRYVRPGGDLTSTIDAWTYTCKTYNNK